MLGITESSSDTSDSFELKLQIERGALDPLENFEHNYELLSETQSKRLQPSSEKVTIVLDPNKGIYSLNEMSPL